MVASRSSSDRWALLRTSLDLTLRHPLLGWDPPVRSLCCWRGKRQRHAYRMERYA